MPVTYITESIGFSLAGIGVLVGAVTETQVAAWAIGITGIGMAAVSVYARYRETRRCQDVEDEKALADSRAKLVHDLKDDLKAAMEAKAEAAKLAAERLAVIQTLRAACPHHESCPVKVLDERGYIAPPKEQEQ